MEAGQQLGKYKLVKKLAVGGMAEIWLAEQLGPAGFNKQLVIKCILPHLANDQKFVEMFLDEARLAANLEHPNIVRISDLGQHNGTYFIAMEYIDGPDVDYMIERCEQLGVTMPLHIAARIIADALNGLEYAHTFVDRHDKAVNLVHRDISPHNVLVNKAGVAKIVDFGVAKAATSSHKTQTGAVKGKFAYMSPEQIANQDLDGRSDLFAMGIVLYEMTTNHRPFGDEGELLAVTAILTKPPTNPREIVRDFPPQMEKIIMKALAKDREERYSSAREMSGDLERFIAASGEFVSTNDVGSFIQDLFSDNPTLLGGQQAPMAPPRYDTEEEATNPSNPMVVAPTPPVGPDAVPKRPRVPTPVPTPPVDKDKAQRPVPPPIEPGPSSGGSKLGLIVGAIVIVLVLGIGGGTAAFLLGGDEGGRSVDPRVEPDADSGEVAGDEPDAEVAKDDDVGEEAPANEAKASVFIQTSPSTTIYFKGKKLGKSPISIKLPVGKQKIVLKNTKKLIRYETEIEVKKGVVADVNENFVRGELKLMLQPPDDNEVWVNGEKYDGKLDKPLSLYNGQYKVKVSNKTTGNTAEKQLEIIKGELTVGEYDLR